MESGMLAKQPQSVNTSGAGWGGETIVGIIRYLSGLKDALGSLLMHQTLHALPHPEIPHVNLCTYAFD